MNRTFTKLFLLAIFTLFTLTSAFGQVTVGTVDAGPYGRGSSIAVPINTASTCLDPANTFKLVLSDASGNFSPGTVIGTYTGFYASFINGVIPAGTPAGTGYKVEVQTTAPSTTSAPSGAFEIKTNAGVPVSLSSSETVATDVFGRCIGSTAPFNITTTSAGTVTADFFNERTQSNDASNITISPGGYSFVPQTTNYTVAAKSVNGGIVSTYDYQLINNIVVNPFSPFGTPFVCIPAGGSGDLQFVIGTTGPGGIVNNYPGTTYSVDWGDGTSTVFTYCQIAALGGILTHTYSLPSCGQTTSTGTANSLLVANHAISPYSCGELASPTTTSAKVIITPTIAFDLPGTACANTAITVTNNSNPGPDYNTSVQSACDSKNPNALYDWYFDGTLVASNEPLSYSYVITAAQATPGPHTMKLHAVAPSGAGAAYCQAADVTLPICFEKKPTASFTILSPVCITSMPVSVNNTSDVSGIICNVPAYTWSVTPATFSFAGGTNKNSAQPKFTFSAAGTYTVNLSIPSSCGAQTAVQTIVVQSTPTAVLSADASFCGTNQTLTFDATAGSQTQTTLSGTSATDTYAWTVTAAKGGTTYSFAGGTSASSQYPQILFKDYDTYTIIVSHTNSCGTVISTQQQLTFVQPPSVDVGIDQTVCASSPVVHNLHGNITGVYTSLQWTTNGTGDGSFSAPTSLTTDYTPGPNDINTGQITLTLQVTNAAPCNIVSDDLILNITPTAFITSPPTETLCSAQPLAYTITANNSLATFAWTASVTSGTATGFTASGTSANINDVITNTGSTDAVVTYNILPTIGSCPGTPFVLTVTVHPLPVLTPPVNAPVCNNQPANITLASNVVGTTYTWTSTAGANISGNTDQPTPTAISSIQDILNNSGTVAQTAIYIVTPYNGTCPGTPVTTVVTVEPSVKPSIVGADQEICFPTIPFQLPGNDPGPFTGEWTQVDANSRVTFSDNTKFDATITNVAASNIPYQFQWTITGAPGCPTSSSIFTLKVDNPAVGGTPTPSPADVCSGSGSTLTLTGYANSVVQWESSTDNATWSVISNTTNQYVTPALTQTTYYRALVHYGTNCPNIYSSTAIVTVHQPPTIADAGPNVEVCNSPFYKLGGNVPTSGTGLWTADINNPAGATFVNATDPKTQVNGLVPGSYTFTWTITASASCPPSAKSVTIKVDPPPIGGTTSSPATVCSGDNSGHITLTGQSGNVVEWQSSIDNGATWQTIANAGTNTTIPYAQLTQTTQYRAGVKNPGLCDEAFSTPTTITVNPIAPIANAGPDRDICNETMINLHGNDPGTFSGMWTQTKGPPVTFANASDPQTQVSGLARGNVYKFKWTIFGLPPCGNTESTVTIGAYADVIASFTLDQSHGCGPTTVSFTNTSTPSPTGTFVWDFGDGSPAVTAVNPPPHTYAPSTDGTEKEYTITLTPTSNCNLQTPFQRQITISPQVPIAALSPNQASACGTFTLIVHNLSPGVNTKYDFYLKDGNGATVQHLTLNDKSDAVFQPIVPTIAANYTVYLTVTDECGHQATTVPQIISVSPSNLVSQIQIKGGIESVCLGSPVTFQNISSGGNRFIIKLYDSGHNLILTLPAGTGETNYTPTAIGTYYVTITAGNDGCGDAAASAERRFTVYPFPQPSFIYVADKDYNISFTNTTPNAGNIPSSSINYVWNFGDGSQNETSYTPNSHRFDYAKSPFTVTLTATTPGTTCSQVTVQTINVKFLGNLFLPNAFMPASSNSQLKTYMAKGFGMKTWKMQIFNNFGQLVWQTTKLDNNGAPVEGWDGTYKGQIVQQGVYIWQITATLLNGEDWKGMSYNNSSPSRTGAIHLIR